MSAVRHFSDRDVLDWVRRRAAGESSAAIAARCGAHDAYVRVATNKVRAADLAESGEDPRQVERAYW